MRRTLRSFLLSACFGVSAAHAQIEPNKPVDAEIEPPPAPLLEEEPPPAPLTTDGVQTAPLAAPGPPAPSAPGPPREPFFVRPPSLPVRVQAPRRDPVFARGRTLRGHRFLPSLLLGQPFIVTHFTALTSASYAQGGATEEVQALVRAGSLTQSFALQVAVLRPWALRVRVQAGASSGLSQDALRAQGTDALYAVQAGTTLAARPHARVQVGLGIDFYYAQDYNINIVKPVTEILNDTQSIDAGLLNKVSDALASALRPSTHLALAISAPLAVQLHRGIGLLGELEYRQPVRAADTDPGARFALGAAFSLDLATSSRVPLGALLGYRAELPTRAGDDPARHRVELGLYYTGRGALGLGLTGEYAIKQDGGQVRMNEGKIAILTRYYWQ